MTDVTVKYKVHFFESGWGHDEWITYYDTEEEARAAVKREDDYNQKNWDDTKRVPEDYIRAEYKGRVELVVVDGVRRELK